MTETLWGFNTRNFRVTLECEPERDPDLSWADADTLSKLESGKWGNYSFRVAVYDAHGVVIGETWLGNSIYADPAEFRDHRACGRANRQYAAEGKPGRCGSYFVDMVHEAIGEARRTWNEPRAKLREVR